MKQSATRLRRTIISFLLVFTLLLPSCAWFTELLGGGRGPTVIDLGGGGTDAEDVEVEQVPVSIPETTKLLDDESLETIDSVSADGDVIVFTEESEVVQAFSVGDVLVSDSSEMAQEGFLRKVTRISRENGQVVVETSSAKLEEAIESGNVEVSHTLTATDIQTEPSQLSRHGNKVLLAPMPDGLEITINEVVLADEDGDYSTTYDQVVANGSILLDPSFDFRLAIEDHTLEELVFLNETTEQVELEISSTLAVDDLHVSRQIANYHFSPITVWVGWLPVVITPVMSVSVGLDGSASVDVHAGVSQQATLTSGLVYRHGDWRALDDLSHEFDFTPPTLSSGCEMRVFVRPQLDLLIYGTPGPYGRVDGYLQLSADPLDSPWWELYAGLEASIGVEFDVLSDVVGSYHDTVIDERWLLAHAAETTEHPAESETEAVEGETQNGVQGEQSIVYGESAFSHIEVDGEEIWAFEGQQGDVVRISAEAEDSDLDTTLTLSSRDGEVLEFDDDGGDGRNSLIDGYTLPHSGKFLIVVTPYSGSGDYILGLDLVEPQTSAGNEAMPIAYGQTVEGYLLEDERHIWRFEGAAGDVVTITMESPDEEIDTYLSLAQDEVANVVDSNDDAHLPDHWDYDSQIAGYTLPDSGEYFILAESLTGDGDYRLALELGGDESSVQTKGIFTVRIIPPDPGEWEDYQIRVDTSPPEAGIAILIDVSGSDGYSFSGEGVTGEDGSVTFPSESDKIPGAAAGVTETVTVTAPELDQEEAFTFLFD